MEISKQEYLSDLITVLVKLNYLIFLAHLGILDLSIGFLEIRL